MHLEFDVSETVHVVGDFKLVGDVVEAGEILCPSCGAPIAVNDSQTRGATIACGQCEWTAAINFRHLIKEGP